MDARQDEAAPVLTRDLPYQPPYQWDRLLGFLAGRAIEGVELVRHGAYWRVVREKTASGDWVSGWIRVEHRPQDHALRVTAQAGLQPVFSLVLTKVSQLFDLACDPRAVYERLEFMNRLREGLCVPGTRVPGAYEAFEMCVRAVLGQQITVAAARTLASRLASSLGEAVDTGLEALTLAFPDPEAILGLGDTVQDRLGSLGVTGQRSATIRALAEKTREGIFEPVADREAAGRLQALQAIRGIGPWTAHYLAMRALKWSDAFPSADYGVKKVLEPMSQKEIINLAEAWRPYRAYATVNIWNYR